MTSFPTEPLPRADGPPTDPGLEPMTPTVPLEQANAPASGPGRRRIGVLIGALAAVVGLLPWLITGLRMPLQNLWAVDVLPGQMPLVLLPISQYALALIVGLLVTGGAVAGLAARSMRGRASTPALFLALFVVQAAAVTQSLIVTWGGLEKSTAATTYLTAVAAVAIMALLVGITAFWLIARAPAAGALIGFAISAVALAPWLSGLIRPFGTVQIGATAEVTRFAARILWWAPPTMIGAAIGWCGLHSAGRMAATLTSLVLLWIVPPLTQGIEYAAGSRIFRGDVRAMTDAAMQMFRSQATAPGTVLPPLLVAVVVAAATWLALFRRPTPRRRRRAA